MSNTIRDDGIVELTGPPRFEYGEKVRARVMVFNDGTFPGKDIGERLVKKGEVGYVVSIGTFLQQFYIYGVEFLSSGRRVGMKGRELEPVEAGQSKEEIQTNCATPL
jgi:nitrogen fixation protein NifZ